MQIEQEPSAPVTEQNNLLYEFILNFSVFETLKYLKMSFFQSGVLLVLFYLHYSWILLWCLLLTCCCSSPSSQTLQLPWRDELMVWTQLFSKATWAQAQFVIILSVSQGQRACRWLKQHNPVDSSCAFLGDKWARIKQSGSSKTKLFFLTYPK